MFNKFRFAGGRYFEISWFGQHVGRNSIERSRNFLFREYCSRHWCRCEYKLYLTAFRVVWKVNDTCVSEAEAQKSRVGLAVVLDAAGGRFDHIGRSEWIHRHLTWSHTVNIQKWVEVFAKFWNSFSKVLLPLERTALENKDKHRRNFVSHSHSSKRRRKAWKNKNTVQVCDVTSQNWSWNRQLLPVVALCNKATPALCLAANRLTRWIVADLTVETLPPPAGGAAVLTILNVLDEYDISAENRTENVTYHRLIEVTF